MQEMRVKSNTVERDKEIDEFMRGGGDTDNKKKRKGN